MDPVIAIILHVQCMVVVKTYIHVASTFVGDITASHVQECLHEVHACMFEPVEVIPYDIQTYNQPLVHCDSHLSVYLGVHVHVYIC